MRWAVVLALLGVYWCLDRRAVAVWESPEALWSHAYALSPRNERVRSNYAKALYGHGREWEMRLVTEP